MASDLEDEEGGGDDIFESGPETSATPTPSSTPMPPLDTLVEQTTLIMEPEPKISNGGVITEQVMGLKEHQRPGSELAGVSVVTEQPVRSEHLPVRYVTASYVNSHIGTHTYSFYFIPRSFLTYLYS